MLTIALLLSTVRAEVYLDHHIRSLAAGLGVVVPLGEGPERRLGVEVYGAQQRFWHESPYYSPGVPIHSGPLASASLRLRWTRPHVTASLQAGAGWMKPWRLGDVGVQPLWGAELGLGLGLSTDGARGPVLGAGLLGPMTDLRVETMRWEGWHGPHLSAGLRLESCCAHLM